MEWKVVNVSTHQVRAPSSWGNAVGAALVQSRGRGRGSRSRIAYWLGGRYIYTYTYVHMYTHAAWHIETIFPLIRTSKTYMRMYVWEKTKQSLFEFTFKETALSELPAKRMGRKETPWIAPWREEVIRRVEETGLGVGRTHCLFKRWTLKTVQFRKQE